MTITAYLAVAAVILGGWQIAALLFPSFLLPDTWEVAGRLVKLIGSGEFYTGLSRSFLRLSVGYTAAVITGSTMGIIAGVFGWLKLFLRAFIAVFQSVPPITWVPLLVILLGFGNAPIIIVVAFAGFFPVAHSVMNASEAVEDFHIDVARTLGASRRQIMRTVYLPELFPAVINGAQISFGNAWRSLVASEMIAGVGIGLGWSISFAGEIADMTGVIANIVVIGCLAALIDRTLLERTKRVLLRWRYA